MEKTFIGFVTADIRGIGYAVKSHNNRYGIVPDIAVLKKSAETVVTASNVNTTGVKIERTYEMFIPFESPIEKKVFAIVRTGAINTVAANPNDKYRVKVSLLLDDYVIDSQYGTEHAPNSTTEQRFEDIIILDCSIEQTRRGQKLKIKVEVEVTNVDPTNPGITINLYCDPETSGNELIFYFQ